MVYAAENSLKEMEANETVKRECDAYTAGVNAYIESLSESELPLEYKLLGYKPEKWNNLKIALFLKYMSWDLAAHENDFEMTNVIDLIHHKFSTFTSPLLEPTNTVLSNTAKQDTPSSPRQGR